MTRSGITFTGLVTLLVACSPSVEQEEGQVTSAPSVTTADYERAESRLNQNTRELVSGIVEASYWQADGSLIYRLGSGSRQYIHVVPETGERSELFDTDRLLDVIAGHTDEEIEPDELVLSDIELSVDGQSIEFSFDDEKYLIARESYALSALGKQPDNEFLSPDGSRAAFIQDHNLWLRNTETNELTQLTFDGIENYGYATNNAGWLRTDGPVLRWSPDSNRIATFRHDGRNVGDISLMSTKVGRPEVETWKYPLVGDEHIFMIERIVINLEPQPQVVRLNMQPDPHRSTTSDHVADRGGEFLDVQWSRDSNTLAFVSSSRDHKLAELRLANPDSGEVINVYREEVETHYMAGHQEENWRILHERNEFLWFSEQDNWGHLYVHDLESGNLKHQLTSGNFVVHSVELVDEENGMIYFQASDPAVGNPYYSYLYRVSIDGGEPEKLTSEQALHQLSWSDSGDYFTDSYSTPVSPPAVLLRNRDGAVIMELEQADISALQASGWNAPEQFTVKARDQVTDLYGLMYKPSNFDPNKSYPVICYLYPGPQIGSVGSRQFRSARGDKQALAELGFVVVEVDAMGTPGRSKSFHDAYYGNMGDNGLPDQATMIRQLAAEHTFLDIDRVGIYGHSGGGNASTTAMLMYPDLFKVAVSSAGNHENRNYEDDWGERWQGLLEVYPETDPTVEGEDGLRTNYDNQSNPALAENLQGKLLLAHGLMDDNVHPSTTLLMVQALIEAEKDFDLVVLPEARHGFGNTRYFMKRRWDYFVEHLLGAEPPAGFSFADNIR